MRTLPALFLAAAALCSGCSVVSVELAHTSHPLRGAPFGPATEEDSLDTANVCARRESGRFYMENCLGYKLRDGGFYGDDFVYNGRIGIKVWQK